MVFAVAVFIIMSVIAAIFQLALALGAPLGEYAMGGMYPGKFPPKMRIAALVQIIILVFLVFVVVAASGLAFEQFYNFGRIAIWFVVAFFVLGSILNISSKSIKERRTWGPVNVMLLLVSIFIALNA
jgi:hypothetical protein